MKIALAQLNFHIGNFVANRDQIIQSIDKAKTAGAELIVFSELAVCGYYPNDLLERREFIDQCIDSVNQIAAHCQGIANKGWLCFLMPHEYLMIYLLAI